MWLFSTTSINTSLLAQFLGGIQDTAEKPLDDELPGHSVIEGDLDPRFQQPRCYREEV